VSFEVRQKEQAQSPFPFFLAQAIAGHQHAGDGGVEEDHRADNGKQISADRFIRISRGQQNPRG